MEVFFSFCIMTRLPCNLTHSINVLFLWSFLFVYFVRNLKLFSGVLFLTHLLISLFFSIFHPQSFSLFSHTYTYGSFNCIFRHYGSIFSPSHIYFTEHIYICKSILQPVKPRFLSTCIRMKLLKCMEVQF